MQVSIMSYTRSPYYNISKAAGICYGKFDSSRKRVMRCFENDHMSVFEHSSVTFLVEGISRACTHQLVRHRLASFSQASQRYIKGVDAIIIPKTINDDEELREKYIKMFSKALDLYWEIIDAGIPAEDARYIIPTGVTSDIVVTMNIRELFHFFDLRMDSHAQWEIRDLALKMYEACMIQKDDLEYFMEMWADRNERKLDYAFRDAESRESEDQTYHKDRG